MGSSDEHLTSRRGFLTGATLVAGSQLVGPGILFATAVSEEPEEAEVTPTGSRLRSFPPFPG